MKDKRNIEIILFLLGKLNFKKTDLIASSNFYLFAGKLYVNSKSCKNLARFLQDFTFKRRWRKKSFIFSFADQEFWYKSWYLVFS